MSFLLDDGANAVRRTVEFGLNSARATWVPTLFLPLGLVGLAAVAWYWWRGDESAPPPPPSVDRPAPDLAAQAVPATVHVEEARTAAGTPADAPVVAELHRFDILVVDAATQQPVADAEAYWSDRDTYAKVQQLPKAERRGYQGALERTAQRFGHRASSDRDGRLRLSRENGNGWVYARTADRYGELMVSEKATPPDGHRLLLHREEVLSARVLDVDGGPAEGVWVGLWRALDASANGYREFCLRLRTDATGMVVFEHLQQRRRSFSGFDHETAVQAFLVGIDIPGLTAEPVVVDAQAPLPKEPIELRLTATGSLRVRFTFEGATVPGIESVRLRAQTGNHYLDEPVDDDGWALFPRLPPGVPLSVLPSGRALDVGSREIPPVVSGALLQQQIELGSIACVLRGRVLDPAGQPLVEEPLEVNFRVGSGGGNGLVRTDERGNFLHFLREPSEEATVALSLYELRPLSRGELRLALPSRALKAGVNELGDLQFGGEPLVCGGRITGGRCTLSIEREQAGAGVGEATWQSLDRPQVGYGRDGVFAAHGHVEPGRYRLRVRTREFLPMNPIEFRVGQSDLMVPLQSGVRLTVECELPDGATAEHLCMDLVGGPPRSVEPEDAPLLGEPTDNRRGHAVSPQDGHVSFQWSAVEPGTYSLHVSLRGLAAPVHTVADVVLPPPGGGDARLPTIDLRTVLRTVRLYLVDGAGQPVEPSGFAFLQPQAGPKWWGTMLVKGDTTLLLPKGAQAMQVVGEDRRPSSLVVPAGVTSVDVKVESWPHVDLSLEPGVAIPDGCDLGAIVVPDRERERVPFAALHRWTGRSGELDAELQPPDGYASLRVGGEPGRLVLRDGRHRLQLVLRRGKEEHLLQRFTPNEVVAGAPVTITLDAAELAEAAKALAPKDAPK